MVAEGEAVHADADAKLRFSDGAMADTRTSRRIPPIYGASFVLTPALLMDTRSCAQQQQDKLFKKRRRAPTR